MRVDYDAIGDAISRAHEFAPTLRRRWTLGTRVPRRNMNVDVDGIVLVFLFLFSPCVFSFFSLSLHVCVCARLRIYMADSLTGSIVDCLP